MEDLPSKNTTTKWSFYKTKRKRKYQGMLILFCVYFGFLGLCALYRVASPTNVKTSEPDAKTYLERHRRAAESVFEETEEGGEKNCTKRAIEEFPGNFLTLKETQDGGFTIHILLVLYIFGSLAIICDDYFVSSLEIICAELKLKEDVAGATFMAAGSSAPEFFTSLIGVFIAGSDVGTGTIVGSAVFNVLFIIGVCALSAGMIIELTWWPLVRDCSFYLLSVIALILVIYDNEVNWYEGMALFLMYLVYIAIMYFNTILQRYFETKVEKCKPKKLTYDEENNTQSLLESQKSTTDVEKSVDGSSNGSQRKPNEIETPFNGSIDPSGGSHQVEHKDPEYESPFSIPETLLGRAFWVGMMPMKILFFLTVPDCRKHWGHWRKTYPLTFIMSIVWISGLSYVMVWMVTIAGDALAIPDSVMGLTLLAAGTSVPDCLASVFVVRDGYGDMAVSNSIGSNVFDILVCLGIPWLVQTGFVNSGEKLEILSKGLTYSTVTLLFTVAFILVAIMCSKWRLGKTLGIVCLIFYVIVIIFSCLYELNVFGDFNLPSCPRE